MTPDDFRRLCAGDREMYESYLAASGSRISDMCFNSRVAWSPGFQYQYAVIGEALCLVSDGGLYTDAHLVMPMGRYDAAGLADILRRIEPVFASQHWPLNVMYIDEHQLPLLEGLSGFGLKAEVDYNRDFSDYLYEAQKLRDLSGKALRSRRNQLNRFRRDFPDARYSGITPEDVDACLRIVSDWCEERGVDPDDLCESDYVPIRRLFCRMDRLPVRGGVLRIGDTVQAFAMGSSMPDGTAVIHFEKVNMNVPGLYAAINHAVVSETFADAQWVNREEDMGIDGLRRAKESYQPAQMIHKYRAVIHRA